MADKVPIRAIYDNNSVATGLAEYQTGETVGVAHGGTGAITFTNNRVLTGNTVAALVDEANLTFDGSTLAVTGATTLSGTTTITGDLTVNGTTTTINSTTLTVDDKNIEMGSVASPSDTTADGGGLTLKGTTDKTILWENDTNQWNVNQKWTENVGSSAFHRPLTTTLGLG